MLYNTVGKALSFGGWITRAEWMKKKKKHQNFYVGENHSYGIDQWQTIPSNENMVSLCMWNVINCCLLRAMSEFFTMTYEEEKSTLLSYLRANGGFNVRDC